MQHVSFPPMFAATNNNINIVIAITIGLSPKTLRKLVQSNTIFCENIQK